MKIRRSWSQEVRNENPNDLGSFASESSSSLWPNGRTLSSLISCPDGASRGSGHGGAKVSMKRSSGAPGAPRVRVAVARRLVGVVASASCVATFVCASPAFAQGEPSELPPEIGYNYNEIETPRIAATGG